MIQYGRNGEGVEPKSSVEFHQMRGRAADLIDWAINEYDGFMQDDDYDSQRTLDRIVARFKDFRNETAKAIEARSDKTGTGLAEGESAAPQGFAQTQSGAD